MTTNDPFEDLASPPERQDPRPRFARELRDRLVAALDLDPDPPPVDLPERKHTMTTSTSTIASAVTPYLTAHDAAAALDWYSRAFGAVEQMRVVTDDGIVGHAEFHIGDAVFYLSDEHPAMGVVSPQSLGGTPFAMHLQVGAVDELFARAVDSGATPLAEPEDQPHGARHGTLVDPFGHRWMLSQQIETVTLDEYAARSEGTGYEVVGTQPGDTVVAADAPGTGGGIWAGVFYADALAGIRFLVGTFGFEEQIVVTGPDDTTVVHSQLRWPEGGIVQAGTYDADNVFTHPPGDQSLYVVTADPQSVWERCQAAGLTVIRPPEAPDHDPDGMGFSVRDPEGNIWSFGTYGLGGDG
ncbi:VOC family protein [Actinospongicola halichondriae]|uniref:VOC family protein n=1 Tax=Actinospongicola halichondriae TaxID=3236844 RepID=UPI003D3856C1